MDLYKEVKKIVDIGDGGIDGKTEADMQRYVRVSVHTHQESALLYLTQTLPKYPQNKHSSLVSLHSFQIDGLNTFLFCSETSLMPFYCCTIALGPGLSILPPYLGYRFCFS